MLANSNYIKQNTCQITSRKFGYLDNFLASIILLPGYRSTSVIKGIIAFDGRRTFCLCL
jgi:hypothetical protein